MILRKQNYENGLQAENHIRAFVLFVCLLFCVSSTLSADTVQIKLNDLAFLLDKESGSILKMSHSGPGEIIDTDLTQASLVDVACPVKQFEPLRLASRFSKNAEIKTYPGKCVISYNRLGASRPSLELQEPVSAVVTLEANPDGHSVNIQCQIKNNSSHSIKQVLFPDLYGIVPFAGDRGTEFRTGGFRQRPFISQKDRGTDVFWCRGRQFTEYEPGGMIRGSKMTLRWWDLGSIKGGISCHPERWGWEDYLPVGLWLSEKTGKLRIMHMHKVDIKEGQTWQSGKFVLNPHKYGWAKGIEAYRKWIDKKFNRRFNLPDHVRNGLGYRTVWLTECYPGDPQGDIVWTLEDLPRLAEEAAQHGLTELSVWYWNQRFRLPMPEPYHQLGSFDDLEKAVKACRQKGVRVALFRSLCQMDKQTCDLLGWEYRPGGNWTRHTELLPPFRTYYADAFRCSPALTGSEQWQRMVINSSKKLIDKDMPCIMWDQFMTRSKDQGFIDMIEKIRRYAKKADPQSTFSTEQLLRWDIDAEVIDYLWNWQTLRDFRPIVSVFKSPRMAFNIHKSIEQVKVGFADNIYLNIQPRKPDGINGSAWIKTYGDLSDSLQSLAALRKKFLRYFTKGTCIGECVLSKDIGRVHTSAYAMDDSLLAVLVNRSNASTPVFSYQLTPWLKKSSKKYKCKIYNENGSSVKTFDKVSSDGELTLPKMEKLDILLVEFLS